MDIDSGLVEKIEKLQRDIFWTKAVGAVLFICLAAGSIANWTIHGKSLAAEEFLLKDRAGNIVGRLGQNALRDTCLTLTANRNVSVSSLCVQDEEGASLDLHNLKSESRVILTPGLTLYEPMSHLRSTFAISEHGQIVYRFPPNAINGEPF